MERWIVSFVCLNVAMLVSGCETEKSSTSMKDNSATQRDALVIESNGEGDKKSENLIPFVQATQATRKQKAHFFLVDTRCVTIGTNPESLGQPFKFVDGSRNTTICYKDNAPQLFVCDHISNFEAKLVSTTQYEASMVGQKIGLVSNSGNVRYLIDIDKKVFSMSQSNINLKNSFILSKSCAGEVVPNGE